MAKVMLVEDDNNLREIYEARLLAEGYEIVSAQDGEEALATAVKEKPDLIIADIMMPKISGFDMLDILRSTPETRDTKVIMMTALSQAEDKERANKLGADKYLVKSQVTLEDVARVAREALEGGPGKPTATADQSESQTPAAEPALASSPEPQPANTPAVSPVAASLPVAPAPADQSASPAPAPAAQPAGTDSPQPDLTTSTVIAPVAGSAPPAPAPAPAPVTNDDVLAAAAASVSDDSTPQTPNIAKHGVAMATKEEDKDKKDSDDKTVVHTKVINPINDISKQSVNFEALVAKEEAKEASNGTAQPIVGQVEVEDKKDMVTPQVSNAKPTLPPDDPSAIAL